MEPNNPIFNAAVAQNMRLAEAFYIYENFFPIRTWPEWAKTDFFVPHKNYRQRYRLWVFLWANAMPPQTCTYWVLWHGGYDRAAHNQMKACERLPLTSRGRNKLREQRVMDMFEGRVMEGPFEDEEL